MNFEEAIEYLKEDPENKVTKVEWCSAMGGTYLIYDAEGKIFKTFSYNAEGVGNLDTELTASVIRLFSNSKEGWIKFPTEDMRRTLVKSKYSKIIDFLHREGYSVDKIYFLKEYIDQPREAKGSEFKISFIKFNNIKEDYGKNSNKTLSSMVKGLKEIGLFGSLKSDNLKAYKFYRLQGYNTRTSWNGILSSYVDLDTETINKLIESKQELDEIYDKLIKNFSNITSVNVTRWEVDDDNDDED